MSSCNIVDYCWLWIRNFINVKLLQKVLKNIAYFLSPILEASGRLMFLYQVTIVQKQGRIALHLHPFLHSVCTIYFWQNDAMLVLEWNIIFFLDLNFAATRDASNLLAHEAAFALGQMQDADAIPALEEILNDFSLHPIVRHEVKHLSRILLFYRLEPGDSLAASSFMGMDCRLPSLPRSCS